ncbi:MAG: YfiR family protein [Spongiibacteraceae bacterium]|nr:YfiR family protein [Spongiibacteraceae bacterium]
MLSGLAGSLAFAEISREYRIKAAYLYNLLRFINWPPVEQSEETPVTICIYGYNPFERYLEKLETRKVDDRPIKIRYVGEPDPLDGCAMLFISQYNTTEPALLSAESPPPILTVSDGDNFLRRGGMVALANVGNNIQLDINLTRGRAAGFQFSANLLEVARTVR